MCPGLGVEVGCFVPLGETQLKRIVLSRVFDYNGAVICNVKSTVPKLYYYVRKLNLQLSC